MAHMTTLEEINQHIPLLAIVEDTDAPFFSVYLNLEDGQGNWRQVLDERARILQRVLKGDDLMDLEEALGMIRA